MKTGLLAAIRKKSKELTCTISALYLAYKRKDVPAAAKILIALTVAYALSPVDLIPDFIPVIGYLDDLVIVPLLVYASLKFIPKEIMEECREQAKDIWKDGKPKRWYYALPIIMVYVFITILIVKSIFFGKYNYE
jgi:uncharacterized membrane protein YkvA (DUF1232 family)